RITKEELEVYDLLRETIFDKNITNYTTIVRTNFADFEDEKKCEGDRKKLKEENLELAELINSCNKVIYVDNPPLKGRSATTNKEIREASREILLKHLIY